MNNIVYRKLIEDSPIPYLFINVIKDKNKVIGIKIKDINESFENMFNTSKDEILNRNIEDFLPEVQCSKFLSKLESSIYNKHVSSMYLSQENMFLNMEVYNYHEDEYHIRFSKLNNENSKISSIVRKSPFMAWIKDRSGVYVDVNDKYVELVNKKYEDIIGKTDKEIWGDKLSARYIETDELTLKNNKIHTYEEQVNIEGYGRCYYEVAKWAYTDEINNVVLGTMGIAIEITDKVTLRESIEKNEQNFIDIANNIDEVIIVRDEKKALYVGPYFETLYGFKPDALYENIDAWYDYWDKIEFVEEPTDYSNKGIDISTFRIVKEGKIDKWIKSKFIPVFDEKGNIIKKIGMLKDITEEKRINEELENLRVEFFANLSHEFRTPINIIMSALQVINIKSNKIFEDNDKFMDKYLNIINQNGFRLIKLVNNLIDVTKINSGNFAYCPKNKDIISVVEDICTSVVDFVDKNNLEIIFDTDVEEKIVAFDLNHLERILLNLISNAIKFSKSEGKIEVTISTEGNIKISVKDEGVGIPEDKINTIFGRFEQVNKNDKREREGSGIGLSLVKALVEMHNGTIEVKSILGEGSEFIVTIPDIVLDEEDDDKRNSMSSNMNQVNKMEVEFSDIYS